MSKNNKNKKINPFTVITDDGIKTQNILAYYLYEITISETIHGTTYIVDGSYEGIETLPSKLKRILANQELRADYEEDDSV